MMQVEPIKHELELVVSTLEKKRDAALARTLDTSNDAARLFACDEAAAFQRAVSILCETMDADMLSGKDCTPPWEKRNK